MRLISCDIENFGKISNRHFEFTDGCNVICEENGWGKSTLAAFIRVMFFGFENPNARDEINNERRRFTPWQGGVYGGKLVFEAEGHRYILSRTFGAKDKDDKFSLRDYETNLETEDFSADTGIDLFKLDGKSFARSVYIAQNDCDTGITDGINAKLGNLAENTDDINNFEKVDMKFKDMLNSMSPTRKTGSLHKLKKEIAEVEQHIRQGEIIDKSLMENLELRNIEKQRYDELKKVQEQLQADKVQLSRIKDMLVLKEKYLGILGEYKEWKRKLESAEQFFNGDVPEYNVVQTHLKNVAIIQNNANEIARCRMSDSEIDKLNIYKELFKNGIPTQEQINEYVSKWNIRTDKKNMLSIKRDNLEFKRSMLAEQSKKNSIKNNLLTVIIAGVVLLLAGIGALFIQRIVGIILLAAGVIAFVCGVVLYGINKSSESNTEPNMDLDREEAELITDEEFIQAVQEELRKLLEMYGYVYDEYYVANNLLDLQSKTAEYQKLLEREKENLLLANDEEIKTTQREIDVFIRKYYNIVSYDVNEVSGFLYDIKSNLQRYQECCREFERLDNIRKNFEVRHDIDSIMNISDNSDLNSMENLDGQLNVISSDLETVHKNILDYTARLEKLQIERDEISVEEERLVELKALFNREQLKYRLAMKSKELLGVAKVSFTRKYMGPITKGFDKYYNILTGKSADEYLIDANGDITIEELGLPRSKEYFSTGYKDLIGICMRMALIDAMYKEEKPFVIFDDPFVNLDEEKTIGGMELLKMIGKEYQIIYFTCHNSRIIY